MLKNLYADENFPLPVVTALRRFGHDVLTAREDTRADQRIPDSEVLLRATELGRAVVTHNRSDFLRIHRSLPGHAGIIICTEDLNFAALAERIHAAISTTPDLTSQLLRINRPSTNTGQPQ
jgi:hypothetical protein